MPEELGPEQVSEGGIFSEIELVRSAFRNRLASESTAEQLESQAAQIREEAKEEHENRWREVKIAILGAAETRELASRELLEAIIDFRAITPAPNKPQRKPLSLMRQNGSIIKQQSPKLCPPLDKDGILGKFDAIQLGEPIMVYDKVGIVRSESTVSPTDRHLVLGAYIHADVEFAEGLEMDLDMSIEYNLDELIVGRGNIQEFIDGLHYNTNPNPHIIRSELRQNLEKLKTIRKQVSELEGFDFDLAHLDKQIASGEWSQARIREHRAHRSRLQKALDPL